jgi:uncharacterized protein YcbK (DUF882 family)
MISKNFSRKEFACKCGCGFDTVDVELVKVLQELRDHFERPITINSACRCLKHNRSIGSTDSSQHVKARAADITVKGVSPEVVYYYLDSKYPDHNGLGRYVDFTHLDTRGWKARW